MLRYIKTGIRTVIIQPPKRAFDKVKEYHEKSKPTTYRFPRATRVQIEKIRRKAIKSQRQASRRRWVAFILSLVVGAVIIYFLYQWTYVYFHL